MNNLTPFQRNGVVIGIRQLMTRNWFSICDFFELIREVDGYIDPEDLKVLHRLHCVDWCTMPHDLRNQAREVIFRALRVEDLEASVRGQAANVVYPVSLTARNFERPITTDDLEPSFLRRKWKAIKRVISA